MRRCAAVIATAPVGNAAPPLTTWTAPLKPSAPGSPITRSLRTVLDQRTEVSEAPRLPSVVAPRRVTFGVAGRPVAEPKYT